MAGELTRIRENGATSSVAYWGRSPVTISAGATALTRGKAERPRFRLRAALRRQSLVQAPLGRHMPNKLLHNYLSTRLGQCVWMPILFLILTERLGLDIALASAPEHVLQRHTDGCGRTVNLEATSGARAARTAWYRENFPISDRAIASGLYMPSLSRREAAALMAVVVLEQLMIERRYEEAIAFAGAILEHDPRAGQVMVLQGSAYGYLLKAEFLDRYRSPFLIWAPLRPEWVQ